MSTQRVLKYLNGRLQYVHDSFSFLWLTALLMHQAWKIHYSERPCRTHFLLFAIFQLDSKSELRFQRWMNAKHLQISAASEKYSFYSWKCWKNWRQKKTTIEHSPPFFFFLQTAEWWITCIRNNISSSNVLFTVCVNKAHMCFEHQFPHIQYVKESVIQWKYSFSFSIISLYSSTLSSSTAHTHTHTHTHTGKSYQFRSRMLKYDTGGWKIFLHKSSTRFNDWPQSVLWSPSFSPLAYFFFDPLVPFCCCSPTYPVHSLLPSSPIHPPAVFSSPLVSVMWSLFSSPEL